MLISKLKDRIKKLPAKPGIYLFKNLQNKPLYIGKALNLKNRIKSYVATEDTRLKKMLSNARKLDFIETNSDIEALILESQLIKKFRPQFNIVMRDDKQYAFVGFTEEKYPRIFITHQPKKNQNFIGPFIDIGALKITLRYLRRVFPYCTCKQLHHNYCLNYHIEKCLGFCCLQSSQGGLKHRQGISLREKIGTSDKDEKTYASNIKAIRKILNGKKSSFIKELKKEAGKAAKKNNFGKAIELRKKMAKLERIFENAKIIHNKNLSSMIYHTVKENKVLKNLQKVLKLSVLPFRIEGYDISNIQGVHATGSMVTFINGQPDKNFYRKFKIQGKNTPDDTAMLKEILERRFKHPEWPFPDLIVIDGGKGQVNAARAVVKKILPILSASQKQNRGSSISQPNFSNLGEIGTIIAVTKNKKHIGEKIYISNRKTPLVLTKLSPADKNLLLAIDSEAHRFAIGYYRKLHRKYLK